MFSEYNFSTKCDIIKVVSKCTLCPIMSSHIGRILSQIVVSDKAILINNFFTTLFLINITSYVIIEKKLLLICYFKN